MLALVGAVAVSLAAVMGVESRSATGLNRDMGNLRQIGQWTHAFAADNEDLYPMLSEAPASQWPALRPTGEPLHDGAKHAIDIIRRRTGREDFPLPGGWVAHILYGHLALQDYALARLPDRTWVSAGDVHRMNWTDDPENKHDLGHWQPFQQPAGGAVGQPIGDSDKRWPYSSSYQTATAWFDKGQSDWMSNVARLSQVGHNSYAVPAGVQLGGQPVSMAAFPSQKVMVHAYGDWYHARQARYFAHQNADTGESARIALLLTDGSARAAATSDANPGWHPVRPSSTTTTRFAYGPRSWEPPTLNGEPQEEIAAGVYRWTRGGLLGRDFGGEEIDTGQR